MKIKRAEPITPQEAKELVKVKQDKHYKRDSDWSTSTSRNVVRVKFIQKLVDRGYTCHYLTNPPNWSDYTAVLVNNKVAVNTYNKRACVWPKGKERNTGKSCWVDLGLGQGLDFYLTLDALISLADQ